METPPNVASAQRSRSRWLIAAITAEFLVIVALGVALLVQGNHSNVLVPNVVGSTQASAQHILSGSGFQYSVAVRPFGPEVSGAPGTVVAQFPPAGTIESSGSPVTLDVSGRTTVPSVVVPSVVGETISSAFRQLRASGLEGGTAMVCPRAATRNSCVPQIRVVVAQHPSAGENVLVGSMVNLVSRPSGPTSLG